MRGANKLEVKIRQSQPRHGKQGPDDCGLLDISVGEYITFFGEHQTASAQLGALCFLPKYGLLSLHKRKSSASGRIHLGRIRSLFLSDLSGYF